MLHSYTCILQYKEVGEAPVQQWSWKQPFEEKLGNGSCDASSGRSTFTAGYIWQELQELMWEVNGQEILSAIFCMHSGLQSYFRNTNVCIKFLTAVYMQQIEF